MSSHRAAVATGAVVAIMALLAACTLGERRTPDAADRPTDTAAAGPAARGLAPVTGDAAVVNGSFVAPLAERFGRVLIGRGSFVTANSTLRADRGGAVCIGSESNVQDNVLLLALLSQPRVHRSAACGERSVSSGDRTSVAHQALVTNSTLGEFVFVGFHAAIRNAVVEDGAFVLHGAVVDGVTIPKDALVGIGQHVTTQADADALPKLTEDNNAFKREVLAVNAEFARGYAQLYEQEGYAGVTGVSPAPRTSWQPQPRVPALGANVELEPFAGIVGDVRLGPDSAVGRRTSIRADEGLPIVIGARAEIGDRVTFHALKGTSITIGSDLDTDDNIVFHGPLTVGDRLQIGDDAILFRSQVGNDVTIGERAIVVGVTLRDATAVPDDAIIVTQAQAGALAG